MKNGTAWAIICFICLVLVAAKAKGGVEKKRAVFAQNMRAIADEHKHDRKGAKHTKVARKRA